ncbi:MAG: hypothetical protein ACFFB3_15755 [Candidatus Hodarchaeota archaeon]
MDLERIQEVLRKYEERLMSLKNVESVGIGKKTAKGKETEELAIVVGVAKKLPPEMLKKLNIVPIPKNLEGIKTDVIQVGKLYAQK